MNLIWFFVQIRTGVWAARQPRGKLTTNNDFSCWHPRWTCHSVNLIQSRQLNDRRKTESLIYSFLISNPSLIYTSCNCWGKWLKLVFTWELRILFCIAKDKRTTILQFSFDSLLKSHASFDGRKTILWMSYSFLAIRKTNVRPSCRTLQGAYILCTIILQLSCVFYDVCDFCQQSDCDWPLPGNRTTKNPYTSDVNKA